jgi:CubicO group peptidase (beta-lactamase class C family)
VPDVADIVTQTPNGTLTLRGFLEIAPVEGFLVAHHGRIAYESYPRMRSVDKHIWWSVSKTLASALVAILEDRGMADTQRPIDLNPRLVAAGYFTALGTSRVRPLTLVPTN